MKKILIPLMAASLSFVACNKVTIKAPIDFKVSTAKTEYKTGDSVLFLFSGNPDNINFYSGETGRHYDSTFEIAGSINIKSITRPAPKNYVWKYAAPGSYKAVFIAQNSDVDHVKRVVREVDLTIMP